ncbi:phosphoribosylformylglycinamidine cyclo-ligase [Alienimonas chondri]|uniref:Phosphoribosylformylglycinamidine cyclo-ligase n=1 Tax=Alienimonas chondri TaxID=2681879 RepID=A0ABX1VDY1_9PLAN|nr:phosphoribosylformylglycinamidine cyclo-ligase [Alienimonas chondri]NNJ26308.1 Phosphoribosylformylglycinamidine cyclo-ligase [Alienimonas chondri]
MEPPFPGVDPFVEGSGRWRQFHNEFITVSRRKILGELGPKYDCEVEVDRILHERSAEERLVGRADWAVRRRPAPDRERETVVLESPRRNAFASVAVDEEVWLSLRLTDRNHGRIVCAVELLSPSNKSGSDRERYLQKRQDIVRSDAHFVEIDLLRGGRHMPLREAEQAPFLALVSRAEERPELNLWPWDLRTPLPTIPIPLLGDDPPVMLDLQEVYRLTFSEGQYHRRVYDASPSPPLDPPDAVWAAELLTAAERGGRRVELNQPESVTEPLSYKSAGVDLDRYAEGMAKLPDLLAKTRRPGVMDLPGGFAGLFRLADVAKFEDPVLVSGTDGVGTKLKVAFAANRYDTVGIDLVAMCANDVLCLGAEPLFFLDYIALDKDDPDRLAALVAGVAEGCTRAGCALLGGETAIMPGVYREGEFDLAGFCVGVAERDRLIDGTKIAGGDVLIGLPSTGLHSNGYSLARKIAFEHAGLSVDTHVDRLGRTVGEEFLEPTRIYARPIGEILGSDLRDSVHGLAHITGGGLSENVERILPDGLALDVPANGWEKPAVFDWLRDLGGVAEPEMQRVFNMGLGFVLIVDAEWAGAVKDRLEALGERPVSIGTVSD